MGKSNAVRRVRSCLKSVRELLLEYGCVDTMTVREAVTRLISEHKEALAREEFAKATAAANHLSAELAIKTRTGAQALATKNHEETRALRRENEQLRSEIEEQRRRIMYLTDESKTMLGELERLTEAKVAEDFLLGAR